MCGAAALTPSATNYCHSVCRDAAGDSHLHMSDHRVLPCCPSTQGLAS